MGGPDVHAELAIFSSGKPVAISWPAGVNVRASDKSGARARSWRLPVKQLKFPDRRAVGGFKNLKPDVPGSDRIKTL